MKWNFTGFRLQEMLRKFKTTVSNIPNVLKSPMKPFITSVKTALYPGLTILSWTSLNIDYCKTVIALITLDQFKFCSEL